MSKAIIIYIVLALVILSCSSTDQSSTDSAYAIFDKYSNDVERDSIFRIAYNNNSTAPSYVVFIAKDLNTGVEKEICCEAPFLSGAIHREFNLGYDIKEEYTGDSIILNNHERVFQFIKEEALKNISFYQYPEYDRILSTANSLDLDYYHETFGGNGLGESPIHFDKDTGFIQVAFAHVMFNCGIITNRDCVAGNNIWFGTPDLGLPKIPLQDASNPISATESTDPLRNPYHNAYMTDISIKEVGRLILIDSIQPMDNNITFKLLDTISSCPSEELTFFLSVYDKILSQADGALAEVMGLYSWKFVQKNPVEFLNHIKKTDSTIIDGWANFIVYEMYFAYSKDSLEFQSKELINSLKDVSVNYGLLRFERTILKSTKSIINN